MTRQDKTIPYHLVLIEFRGVRMFFHPKSGRAALRLEYFHMMHWSSVELFRHGKSLATARPDSVGTHAPFEAFRGDYPLIATESGMPKGWAYDIKACNRGLKIGDEIVIRLTTTERLKMPGKQCTPRTALRAALRASKARAYAEHLEGQAADEALAQIDRLIPDRTTRVDFILKNGKKTWKQLLQLARRQHAQ